MPFMRSNKRQRARARLATSTPVNMMFSNGLGVCKLGNAGSKSICLNKTREISIPEPSLKILQQATQNATTVTFKIYTNIVGATMTFSPTFTNLTLTAPSSLISVYGEQTFIYSATPGTTFSNPDVKLTLTGGVTVGRGSSTHTVSSVTIDSFIVDTVLPVITQGSLANPLLTEPTPYMNQVQTPSTFQIKSTKVGVIALSNGFTTTGSTAIPAGATGGGTTFTLASITPSGSSEAYKELTVTVTDALGNVSLPFIIAAGGSCSAPAVSPENAFIIDKAAVTAPATPAAQVASDIITIPLEATTADTAPFKQVTFGGIPPTAIVLSGTAAAALGPILSVKVIQPTPSTIPLLEIVVTTATTSPTAGTLLEVQYIQANTGPGNEIQDQAGNLMPDFSNLQIEIA